MEGKGGQEGHIEHIFNSTSAFSNNMRRTHVQYSTCVLYTPVTAVHENTTHSVQCESDCRGSNMCKPHSEQR